MKTTSYKIKLLLSNDETKHYQIDVTSLPGDFSSVVTRLMHFVGGEWMGWLVAGNFYHKDAVLSVEVEIIK